MSKLQNIYFTLCMKHLIYISAVLILASCTSYKTSQTLKDVETYIAERPDSALAVLEAMDRNTLSTKGTRAHHALLHAMALDKNYIDVTDDSLALTAVCYYQRRGPKKNLARSMYYLGLSYFYDGQYDKSIIELSKAEPVAAAHDSLYLGFIKVLEADMHNINYNGIDELSCLEEALAIYSGIQATYYVNIAKRRLAEAYISNGRYYEAENLLEELLVSDSLNDVCFNNTMETYAFLMGTRPDSDYSKAVTYYEKTAEIEDGRYMSKQDYWVWAYALIQTGDLSKARQIIDRLSPIDTSGTAYYWQYEIAKSLGKTAEALALFEKFSEKNNEEVVQILKQSVSTVQRDFYQSQYEISEYQVRNRSLILLVVMISAAFIITLICFSAFRYIRRKEEEKERYIRYAEEVSRQLDDFRNGTYSDLQKKYISMHKAKYDTLRTLFEKYIQSEGRIDADKIIYKKVVSLINDLRREIENNRKFERHLDSDLNGILTHLKKEFPQLKQKYYTLFGFLALGFNTPVISHFMGFSETAIYTIKSRLKKLIEESDAEHKADFLEIIG